MLASRVSNASCPWKRGEYASCMRFQFHGFRDEDRTWYENYSTGNSGELRERNRKLAYGVLCLRVNVESERGGWNAMGFST
jgi:hypothetical protein